MIDGVILKQAIVVIFSTAMFTGTGITYAFDMCNMMNPSKLRGDYKDRDNYYRGPGVDSDYGYKGHSYGYGAPQPGSDALQAEIEQLKQRIKNLEKALTHESFRPQSAPTDSGTG